MGKPMRKPRPTMPLWWWWNMDGCWACKNRNNCNQCKVARRDAKELRRHQLRKERRTVRELGRRGVRED